MYIYDQYHETYISLYRGRIEPRLIDGSRSPFVTWQELRTGSYICDAPDCKPCVLQWTGCTSITCILSLLCICHWKSINWQSIQYISFSLVHPANFSPGTHQYAVQLVQFVWAFCKVEMIDEWGSAWTNHLIGYVFLRLAPRASTGWYLSSSHHSQ